MVEVNRIVRMIEPKFIDTSKYPSDVEDIKQLIGKFGKISWYDIREMIKGGKIDIPESRVYRILNQLVIDGEIFELYEDDGVRTRRFFSLDKIEEKEGLDGEEVRSLYRKLDAFKKIFNELVTLTTEDVDDQLRYTTLLEKAGMSEHIREAKMKDMIGRICLEKIAKNLGYEGFDDPKFEKFLKGEMDE